MVADAQAPNQKVSMFREILSKKACAKFCMKKQCTCWGSGAQGLIFVSPMRTKALLEQIYKLNCLHSTDLRTFREMCHFPVTLHRLSRAIPHFAWRTKEQINPFPVLLPWGFGLPCSPACTPLPALLLSQPDFFSIYYVMHTVLHLFKQICSFRNFY